MRSGRLQSNPSSSFHPTVDNVFRMDRNEYFKNPVSKFEVPDYFDVIQRPMCWNTIEEKLARHEYWDVQTFKVNYPTSSFAGADVSV